MTLIRIILAAAALVLATMIALAIPQADIGRSFAAVVADPWGAVSLVDLYAGLLAFGIVVWFAEPDHRIRLILILLLPFLGNLVALIWLAWRLPDLVRRLSR